MKKSIHKGICSDTFFSSFFNKHIDNLYNFLYYKFGEKLDPRDKTQEAFLKVWQNCHKIPPDKAKSYLYTTANNLMLNQASHEKVALRYTKEIHTKKYTHESPEFVMEEKQYLQKIQTALSNLNENQRVAFLLNRVEGKRFKEVSGILGISVKAVEKRVYSALKKLKQDIEGL